MARILLVEDNEMNRDMLSRRLARRGFEVLLAEDGEEAIAVAGREQRAEATAGIPVLALTAHAMSTDRDRALEAGCDDYDTKPVDMPRLLGKIERLLGAKAGREEGPGG